MTDKKKTAEEKIASILEYFQARYDSIKRWMMSNLQSAIDTYYQVSGERTYYEEVVECPQEDVPPHVNVDGFVNRLIVTRRLKGHTDPYMDEDLLKVISYEIQKMYEKESHPYDIFENLRNHIDEQCGKIELLKTVFKKFNEDEYAKASKSWAINPLCEFCNLEDPDR